MTLLLNDIKKSSMFCQVICLSSSATETYPQREPDSVQNTGNNKVPANAMDGNFMSRLKPLVDNETSQKEVDDRPHVEHPGSYMDDA